MNNNVNKLDLNDKSNFTLLQSDSTLHDVKFETKPVSFLKDSIRRFAQNKASIVAAVIILIIILFAIIGPYCVGSSDAFNAAFPNGYDTTYKDVLPKMFSAGTGFWDGCSYIDYAQTDYYLKKYTDSNYPTIIIDDLNPKTSYNEATKQTTIIYHVNVDSYAVGISELNLSVEEYNALLEYDLNKYGEHRIIKPMVDYDTYLEEYAAQLEEELGRYPTTVIASLTSKYQSNNNVYYKLVATKSGNSYTNQVAPSFDENGNIQDLYVRDTEGNLIYGQLKDGRYNVRVDYTDYFEYKYGFIPKYYFGTNSLGQDLFLRLANGARFSFLLGIGVTIINFIIGLIYGSISGYYGGRLDLIMERITDILSAIPSVIVMTLVSLNVSNNSSFGTAGPVIALLIGFVATGWIGTASTTRMQFYRYKGQEYVLASRTLGAKDRRLIFKHILPNAAGTLVTSTVLMIPSVIFSESTLTYLGIINLSLTNFTSIGTLLSEGQTNMQSSPYLLIFPAIVVSLLMISFNLFGNGLRDAFNTQLRGNGD